MVNICPSQSHKKESLLVFPKRMLCSQHQNMALIYVDMAIFRVISMMAAASWSEGPISTGLAHQSFFCVPLQDKSDKVFVCLLDLRCILYKFFSSLLDK